MGNFHLLKTFILILLVSVGAYAQDDNDPPYHSETAIGINLNTNGGIIGGAMFKRSVHFKKNQYHLFALEIVNVKHNKEQRYQSAITGNTYIYYKENYFFVIRPQYGREFILFDKSDDDGVRVNGLIAAGPSFGILKPYAIDYDYTDYTNYSGAPTDVVAEPFDPSKHGQNAQKILGTGGLLTAVGSSKFRPGLSLKAALNFELGISTTGVEAGFLLELYPQKINIMGTIPGTHSFSSIYLNIYFSSRN